jgi:uncharacterized protein
MLRKVDSAAALRLSHMIPDRGFSAIRTVIAVGVRARRRADTQKGKRSQGLRAIGAHVLPVRMGPRDGAKLTGAAGGNGTCKVQKQREGYSMTDTSLTNRPAWLRIVHPLVRLIILGGVLFYFMGRAEHFLNQFQDRPLLNILVQIGLALAAIALYFAYGKFVERREVTELSTPGIGREWAIGALIGVGLYSACAIALMLLGYYKVEGLNPVAFVLPALALAIKSGAFEELIFRGVLHQSVESIFGSWAGILAASFIFGFLHLLNPAATMAGAIYISIEAGLLLSAAYMVTRRLWICMGFHMGWNFVQEGIYSGVVSGGPGEPGLLKAVIEGPTLLTGGNFGMEQSIFALIFCTTTGVILLVIAIRRGHLLPPMWKR